MIQGVTTFALRNMRYSFSRTRKKNTLVFFWKWSQYENELSSYCVHLLIYSRVLWHGMVFVSSLIKYNSWQGNNVIQPYFWVPLHQLWYQCHGHYWSQLYRQSRCSVTSLDHLYLWKSRGAFMIAVGDKLTFSLVSSNSALVTRCVTPVSFSPYAIASSPSVA